MRIGTLFSGIGSPEQGARRVYGNKLELVFACEWDKYARESFKANYEIEDRHFHVDINDMDGTQYKNKVDIIIGGSPCQDFSIAGLRAGIEGNRGILIYQYFRIIDEVKPPIFIYENVKGMLSDKKGKTIKEFVEAFRQMGYFCHYEVLNTKDYGIPQNRERVFIVGFLDHEKYYRFQFAPKQKLEKRLKDILESDVDEKYYLSQVAIRGFKAHAKRMAERGNGFKFAPTDGNCIASSITTRAGGRADDNFINEGVVGMLDIKGNDCICRVYGVDGAAPCLQTMQGGNREPKIVEPMIYDDYNGNLKTDGIACTLTTNCGSSAERNGQKVIEPKILDLTNDFGEGKIREYTQFAPTLRSERFGLATEQNYRIRKLTPRECFRLQDFPDTFKFVVSNSQLYKQAGNSISVNIMEMIFNQIEKSRTINLNGSLF